MFQSSLYRIVNSTADIENAIETAIEQMTAASNRLIFIVRKKTDIITSKTIENICVNLGIQRINVGLHLSEFLMEHDVNQAETMLKEKIRENSEAKLLDNIEILFDDQMGISPFLLLNDLARHNTIICTIDAFINDAGALVYGKRSFGANSNSYIIDMRGDNNEI